MLNKCIHRAAVNGPVRKFQKTIDGIVVEQSISEDRRTLNASAGPVIGKNVPRPVREL